MNIYDEKEENVFTKYAEEWWDKNGKFKTLHAINPVRMHFIEQNSNIDNLDVLDIGCGGGLLTETLAYRVKNIIGIDINNLLVNIAKNHKKKNNNFTNLIYKNISIKDFYYNNTQKILFDMITCMELLEHVKKPKEIIKYSSRLLKKNGILYISTINRNIKSYIYTILLAEYIMNILPKGTHQYEYYIQPCEIVSWCREYNLKLLNISGIQYNPFWNTASLTKNIKVNYIASFIKE